MKTKAFILGLILASLALAGQQTFRLTRSFRVGESDTYKLHSTVTMAMGDADVSMKLEQTVKKVYDNGEADIEGGVSDMHVMFNGNEVPSQTDTEKSIIHVDKQGMPTEKGKGAMSRLQFVRFASVLFDRDLKVGDTVPVDLTDPVGKSKVTGSCQIVSITDGQAKIVSTLAMKDSDNSTPSILHFSSWFDIGTSKLNRMEGDVANMNIQVDENAPPITAMKFVMERVK